MKLVTMALRDFAVSVPRTGSIETHSGYGPTASEGQEIHSRVQRRRLQSDPSYRPEVLIGCSFERAGYRFHIEGRMDGFFQHKLPKIEEIKTCFDITELADKLLRSPMDHPYCLQLRTYGYFYWTEHKVVPKLTFHLVSSRNGKSEDLVQSLDLAAYERWMESRFVELVGDLKKAEKRTDRRKKIAASFAFPFDTPRPGQSELIHTIEQGMIQKSRMLIQAPTGLGKTVAVLYPVLREALSRGQTVIYATPKNSQHMIAEDVIKRFQETGANVKSLSITAKSKICFKNEPLCDPAYCEYSRDYYAKIDKHGILGLLSRKRKLKAHVFRDAGERYEVCPFELQFEVVHEADIVICDYNYVFGPKSPLQRRTVISIDQSGRPNLVVDEIHNLPSRAMDYYSASLSSINLESMRDEIRKVNRRFQIETEELLDGCLQAVISCRSKTSPEPARIEAPAKSFLEQDSKLRAFLSRYLDSDSEIQPHDVIMRLCFYWSEFTDALEYARDPGSQEFFTTFHPHSTGGIIKISCCDASAMLKERYDEYEQMVGFSATLKPFEYYAKLSGLDLVNLKIAEFSSPFPRELRKLLIIPQISTKFSDRESNYPKIASAIHKIASLREGNYFAFFPSYEFMERVYYELQPPEGFSVLRQERDMKLAHVEAILAHLHSQTCPTIVFAVQGGTFSEGVDYPGKMVIGAFVVGAPLPNYDLEREQMRAYYQKRYGTGFDYAYMIPAMAKAIQSAGRVIRSSTDCGVIVLMDNRFVQPSYARIMPADWFNTKVDELVSKRILKDISEFWESDPVQKKNAATTRATTCKRSTC